MEIKLDVKIPRAIIGYCKLCNIVVAMDLNPSERKKQKMRSMNYNVAELDSDSAKKIFKKSTGCTCNTELKK